MNDPEYSERWRYTDNLDAYNNIIEEFQKLYEQTSTANCSGRAKMVNVKRQSKRALAESQTQTE